LNLNLFVVRNSLIK